MPELPEVETVRRQLAPALVGAHFVSVEMIEPVMLRDCTAQQVLEELPGKTVLDVARLGKFLILQLDEDYYLTLHLGMTGQLLISTLEADGDSQIAHSNNLATSESGPTIPLGVTPLGAPALSVDSGLGNQLHKHTRFAFLLEQNELTNRLSFRDARKFGRVHLTVGGPAPRLSDLGPDAWLGEWDAVYLAACLKNRKVSIKAFLLDQRHLSGIGNIYADETLWWTGISPLRPCNELTDKEIEHLATEIRIQLEEGVKRLGCTFSDFVDTKGKPGTFQEQLKAYGRQGRACSRCGASLGKIVVAGRGTTYCPICQH